MRSTYTWAHKIKNNKSVNKTQYPPYGHVPHDLRFYKLSSSYVKLYLTSIFGLTVPMTHMPSNSVSWSSVTGSF